jgi:sulfur carrier protein ThiS
MNADTEQERPAVIQVKFSYWGLEPDRGPSGRAIEVRAGTTLEELLGRMSRTLNHDLVAETARDGVGFLTLNGSYCTLPDGLSRELEEGDDVRLLPFVAGG